MIYPTKLMPTKACKENGRGRKVLPHHDQFLIEERYDPILHQYLSYSMLYFALKLKKNI